jgi:hypothetical protein
MGLAPRFTRPKATIRGISGRFGWQAYAATRDDRWVRVEVIGQDCPVLPGVVVGVQRRSEVVDEQPADGGPRRWVFDVEVRGGDFRGPYVNGRPGARFIYLSWQMIDSGMFRRAKLMLDAVPADVLQEALNQGLRANVSLTMTDGSPLCAAVRPPAIAWSAKRPRPEAPMGDQAEQ